MIIAQLQYSLSHADILRGKRNYSRLGSLSADEYILKESLIVNRRSWTVSFMFHQDHLQAQEGLVSLVLDDEHSQVKYRSYLLDV